MMRDEQLKVVVVEVAKLELKPDDVVVLQLPCKLSMEQAKWVRESLGQYFPNKVLVIGDGGKLQKVSGALTVNEAREHLGMPRLEQDVPNFQTPPKVE